jgi:hypothetical protein
MSHVPKNPKTFRHYTITNNTQLWDSRVEKLWLTSAEQQLSAVESPQYEPQYDNGTPPTVHYIHIDSFNFGK